jgi:hypothetical protein
MRMTLLGLAMIAFVGAAFAQSEPSAQTRTKTAYSTCLLKAVERVDDRSSDIAAVARAILKICRSDFDQVVDSYTQSVPPEVKANTRERALADPSYLDNALAVVRRARQRPTLRN